MMIFLRSVLASARATTTLEAEGERLWMTTPRLHVVISVLCLNWELTTWLLSYIMSEIIALHRIERNSRAWTRGWTSCRWWCWWWPMNPIYQINIFGNNETLNKNRGGIDVFLIILVMMMMMMIWLAEFGEADEPGAEEDGRHWEDKVGDCDDDDRQVKILTWRNRRLEKSEVFTKTLLSIV